VRHAVATLLVAAAVALPGAAGAAPGDLDPSFGGDGIVTTSFGGGAEAYAVAVLPNGKIVVAGSNNDFALARYLPDGTLDPVFDGDGKVTTDFAGFDGTFGVAIQPNGRIVAAGGGGSSSSSFDSGGNFALARYKRDGGLDLTFGADGKVVTDLGGWSAIAADVAIQPDGKIVAVGTRDLDDDSPGLVGDFAVVRYNPDGSLDAGFGSNGVVLTELLGEGIAVALQDDGKIVVAGYTGLSGVSLDTALVRYEADGTLDTSFHGDGIAILDLGHGERDLPIDLAIQSDRKIVVAGTILNPGDFLLARLNPDGSLDTHGLDPYLDAPFGAGGQVGTDFGGFDYATAIAIESGGKLVAAGGKRLETAGGQGDFALARYNLDGSLDQTLGAGGRVTTDVSSSDGIEDVAVQSDGSIVVVGWASGNFAVARYLAAPCCGVGGGIPPP
jgi:uncharacterized delta-60 repeat protein